MTDESWIKALSVVREYLPEDYELSATQLVALQAAWEGKGYKEYAKKGCSVGYMSNVMMDVYTFLSERTGKEIRKNNFRQRIQDLILNKVFLSESSLSPQVQGTSPKISGYIERDVDHQLVAQYQNQKIIIINGCEGIGKTAFTSEFFDKLAKTNNYQKYIWYSLVKETFEHNILQINKLINPIKPLPSIDNLLDYISAHKSLIVIDGIDHWISNYLDETTNLVKRIITYQHKSLFVLNFRNSIEWFKSLQQQGYPVVSIKLEGLSLDGSRELFHSQGVTDKAVDHLYSSIRGVPQNIIEACKKINFMNNDIHQYIKYKTIFLTNSSRNRLDNIFGHELSKINVKDKYILYLLMKSSEDYSIDFEDFMSLVKSKSQYTIPDILETLELLEDYSLVTIDRSKKLPRIVKHDEVRGYIVQDPLKLFQFEDVM